jgi:catechol 2,3-dioxygenase-like lactoylglutathione lyase family enzyme
MRIEHANITVNDVDASVAFYQKLFDAKLRWQGSTSSGNRAAHIGVEDTYLALFEADGAGKAASGYGTVGFNHLGFQVDNLDVYKSKLDTMGVALKGEDDYAPGRRLYFYDPDGIEIELVEY